MIEMIHFLVECLDKHFGNVCELDILFHLDEVRVIGERGRCLPSMQSVVPRRYFLSHQDVHAFSHELIGNSLCHVPPFSPSQLT